MIQARTLNELLNDREKSLAMWQRIIQKCIDSNDAVGVERSRKDMDGCAKRYDSMISEKRIEIERIEMQQMEHRKKIHDLAFGNPMVEMMTDVLSAKRTTIRGFVMVAQWDEHLISNEFTTFQEFLEQGPTFMTMYRPNELKEKRAHHGHVLYEIAENGIMKKLDANYDSSD